MESLSEQIYWHYTILGVNTNGDVQAQVMQEMYLDIDGEINGFFYNKENMDSIWFS